jgi:hypothetical protein
MVGEEPTWLSHGSPAVVTPVDGSGRLLLYRAQPFRHELRELPVLLEHIVRSTIMLALVAHTIKLAQLKQAG